VDAFLLAIDDVTPPPYVTNPVYLRVDVEVFLRSQSIGAHYEALALILREGLAVQSVLRWIEVHKQFRKTTVIQRNKLD
jgi:hypothetical protein